MPSRNTPWYREPWVWLLVALPLSAVVGGMITIYLAITTADGLVVDDYYKKGKAINRELVRDQAAARYGLRARVGLDVQGGTVAVVLDAVDYHLPDRLQLSLLHPTRAGGDQVISLARMPDGQYLGRAVVADSGSWHVLIEAEDWRLTGRLAVPQAAPAELRPLVDAAAGTASSNP